MLELILASTSTKSVLLMSSPNHNCLVTPRVNINLQIFYAIFYCENKEIVVLSQ